MNVCPDKLIRHISTSIGKMLRAVKGKPRPGMNECQWECPLHPDGDACLSATSGPKVVFSCSNPSCRFRGDAATLVSMALKVPMASAVGMFKKDGAFSDCMAEPLSDDDARAYLETSNSQAMLKAWLAKARARLRSCPEKSGLRPGLSRLNIKLLHPDVGMFASDGEDVPRCLREFEKPKYAKSCLILYPYTMNGEVTRIEVLDTTNPSFRYVAVVTHPTKGVFGEELVGDSQAIIASERPEVAAKLYAAYAAGSTRTPPVVAFSGYPLPEAFINVTNLDIFSAADAPVSTDLVLRTLSASEIKSGRQPLMHVAEWLSGVDSVRFDDLANLRDWKTRFNDLQYMVAKRFSSMVSAGESKKVLELLAAEQTPASICNLIRSVAQSQVSMRGGFSGDSENTQKLIDLLESPDCGEPSNVSLANGRALHCGPDGVFAIRMSGSREAISNVGLTVDARVIGEAGEAFDCTAAARGGFPAVKVRFAWRDLTAEGMRAVVQRAYADIGLSPYIAFYTSSGFAWRDVMSKLAENCPVEHEERKPPIELGKPVSGGSAAIGRIR